MNLADPYLKTARAKEHLENLREELEIFYKSKPCRFTRQDDLENERHIVKMEVRNTPDNISLIAGDLFYCLRASLDQLVWCLAKLTCPYPKGTQFPILDHRNAARFKSQTDGVPAEAAKIIESLQPYNGRDTASVHSHLLWRLNKMCNIDKHMRIPVYGSTGFVTLPPSILALGGFNNDFMMDIPLNLKSEMALDPKVTLKVVFGDLFWTIECDFEGIEAMYAFVTDNVFPKFARFFP
jgi:hypothetical protein